jgi:hypothetical protein
LERKLTEVGRVVVKGAGDADRVEKGDRLDAVALVDAASLGQHVHVVKHFPERGAGLMDGADDGAPLRGQTAHQSYATRAR